MLLEVKRARLEVEIYAQDTELLIWEDQVPAFADGVGDELDCCGALVEEGEEEREGEGARTISGERNRGVAEGEKTVNP